MMYARVRYKTTIIALALLLVIGCCFAVIYNGEQMSKASEEQPVQVVQGPRDSTYEFRGADHIATNTHKSAPGAGETVASYGNALASHEAQVLIASAYPLLRDVQAQCDQAHCAITADATQPLGGNELSSYETMLRSGLATTVKPHGYILSETPQIEEIGADKVRILWRLNRTP